MSDTNKSKQKSTVKFEVFQSGSSHNQSTPSSSHSHDVVGHRESSEVEENPQQYGFHGNQGNVGKNEHDNQSRGTNTRTTIHSHSHDGNPYGGHGQPFAQPSHHLSSSSHHSPSGISGGGHSHDGNPCGGHGQPFAQPSHHLSSNSHHSPSGISGGGGHSHDGNPCGGHGQPFAQPNHHLSSSNHHSPSGINGGGHSHDGNPCGGHGNPGNHNQQHQHDQEYKKIEAHIKWIIQDHKSALAALDIRQQVSDNGSDSLISPNRRAQSRFLATAISEILRMGPKPESVELPPSHPFMQKRQDGGEIGPIGVFIRENVMEILIGCCSVVGQASVDWIKDPRKNQGAKDFEYDLLVYMECILDLLYSLYDDFEEPLSGVAVEGEEQHEIPVSKNVAILDQFLKEGKGIKLLKSIPVSHILPPLVSDIGELRVAIETLLKSFQVFLCKCNREGCGKVEERQGEFKSCAKCRLDVYCSRECQVGAWSTHKLICGKIIRPFFQNPDDVFRAAVTAAAQGSKISGEGKKYHGI